MMAQLLSMPWHVLVPILMLVVYVLWMLVTLAMLRKTLVTLSTNVGYALFMIIFGWVFFRLPIAYLVTYAAIHFILKFW